MMARSLRQTFFTSYKSTPYTKDMESTTSHNDGYRFVAYIANNTYWVMDRYSISLGPTSLHTLHVGTVEYS